MLQAWLLLLTIGYLLAIHKHRCFYRLFVLHLTIPPVSCKVKEEVSTTLFGDTDRVLIPCEGCKGENIFKHNGTYALIKDWANKDLITGKKGRLIRYVDLLK